MGISTLNFSLSFILALILISSIIAISLQIEDADAQVECSISDYKPDSSDNKDAVRLLNKGVDFFEIGKYQRALTYFDQALEEDPNFAIALNNKGFALEKLEKYEEAIESYDQALIEDPSYTSPSLNKGSVLHKLEKYEEAVESFDQALEEDPNFAKALVNKGLSLYSLGKYEEAVESFDQALEEDPNCDPALKWKNKAQDKLDNNNNVITKTKVIKQVTNEEPLSPSTTTAFTGGNITLASPSSVIDSNNPPVASDSSITTTTNKPIDTQLLASDKDNDELTASIVSTPSNGVLSGINQENGMVTYTPNTEFIGTDTFTFKVNDGKTDSNSGLVTIAVEQEPTVIPIANDTANNPPFAHDESVTTSVNKPIDITLPSSDPDQNDELTASIVFQPSNGVLSDINQNTGVVTYTPNTDFASSDNFMFKVNDGKTDSNSGLVTIAVEQGEQEEEEQIPISPTTSIADEITKLANLRDRGSISEQEFSQLKLDIIAKSSTGNTKSGSTIISGQVDPKNCGNLGSTQFVINPLNNEKSFKYEYAIQAKTLKDAVKEANLKFKIGEETAAGKTSYSKPRIEPIGEYKKDGKFVQFSCYHVVFSIYVSLPQWSGPCKIVQDEWKKGVENLRKHEQQHVEKIKSTFKDIHLKLSGKTKEEALKTIEDMFPKLNRDQINLHSKIGKSTMNINTELQCTAT